jgi:tetratricopeptide (TPR) repeat protein
LSADKFPQAEARQLYLQRAKRLAPDDPEQWYLCGVQELFDEQSVQAWGSWRHCLELSDRYMPNILGSVAANPNVVDVLSQVLPDNPTFWLAAADQLYPTPETAPQRRPLLEKALALLERPPGPQTAGEIHLLAVTHTALDQPEAAVAAYRLALEKDPHQLGWRFELAKLLCEQRRFPEAQNELRTILARQPGHGQAKSLLEAVALALARGE